MPLPPARSITNGVTMDISWQRRYAQLLWKSGENWFLNRVIKGYLIDYLAMILLLTGICGLRKLL